MIQKNVPLSAYSNFKIGGSADYFLEIFSEEDLLKGLGEWRKISKNFFSDKKNIFVLGGGTNILFSDTGLRGLVIKNSIGGINISGNNLRVGAGVDIAEINRFCLENSLSGLEWSGGLPGTIGGAIRGNAGAFNGETKDSVEEVLSINLKTLKIIKRNNKDCNFSYRSSIFKTDAFEEIIISAVLKLSKGDKSKIAEETNRRIEYRRNKHPLEYPNIGSIFKNIPLKSINEGLKNELSEYVKNDPFPVVPAAKLIFLANLKGQRVGDVMISEKHTNFIVNLGRGRAEDVKRLIIIIKKEIEAKFAISLEEEIMYV